MRVFARAAVPALVLSGVLCGLMPGLMTATLAAGVSLRPGLAAAAPLAAAGESAGASVGDSLPQAVPAGSAGPAAAGLKLAEAVEGQAISAQSVGYLCQLDVAHTQRWVPAFLFIAHDPETGRVVISDPIALHFNGGLPVRGKVAAESTARISFTWDYPVGKNSQQTRKMLFRAGLDKRTGKVIVTAIPAGFDTLFQADGRCESQPLEELTAQP